MWGDQWKYDHLSFIESCCEIVESNKTFTTGYIPLDLKNSVGGEKYYLDMIYSLIWSISIFMVTEFVHSRCNSWCVSKWLKIHWICFWFCLPIKSLKILFSLFTEVTCHRISLSSPSSSEPVITCCVGECGLKAWRSGDGVWWSLVMMPGPGACLQC